MSSLRCPHTCNAKYLGFLHQTPENRVVVASMHLTGATALWFQSQPGLHLADWEGFIEAICFKFGKGEFQHTLRAFSGLRQLSSVIQYAEKFNELMHHMLAHHASWEPLFFVTHFLDGLKDEIRAPVALQCPSTLDTAVSLACLQEELLESSRWHDTRRYDPSPTE